MAASSLRSNWDVISADLGLASFHNQMDKFPMLDLALCVRMYLLLTRFLWRTLTDTELPRVDIYPA